MLNRYLRALCWLSAAGALVSVTTIRIRGDDPVSSSVRYTGEIVRIFARKCGPCHGTGGLAMPLSNYREVRDWGRAIREEIVEQRMPPWSAARGYRRFQNELALTAREATTILSWLDGGMPRGDDRDLPKPPSASNEEPAGLRVAVAPQRVPALEDHIVRRVTVDTNLDAERTVARIVVNPGDRRVLRAALVFAGDPDRDGRWVGAWLPWQPEIAWPIGAEIKLPARTQLTVELHYRGAENEVTDRPSIDVYYTPARPAPKVRLKPDSTYDLKPKVRLKPDATYDRKPDATYDRKPDATYDKERDELAVPSSAPFRIARSTTVWAILPSADATTTSLELTARRPNGSIDVLLWMPEVRGEWPQALVLQDPVTLPAGTTVSLAAHPAGSAARARLSLLRRSVS